MRPINSIRSWFAAAVCVLATAGFAAAEEGVVRLSGAINRPGIVRMNARQRPSVMQTAYGTAGHSGMAAHSAYRLAAQQYQPGQPFHPGPYQSAGFAQPMAESPVYQPMALTPYASDQCGCGSDGCSEGCKAGRGRRSGRCSNGSCDGAYFPSGRQARKMRRRGELCDSDISCADGYDQRMVTLFARALPDDGCTRWGKRWWRGQQHNYLSRNQRLANTLFGWLVPSGGCGQGISPFGAYHVTYADDPGYADERDSGQAYGVQGYGVPLSVPLAPNVRQSYNYSWGTPSSRITPLGQYSAGAAQQAPYQSW